MSRVIVTGQAVIDQVLRVPRVPAAGSDIYATAHKITVGGAFNTASAAARVNAQVIYAGGHGTGANGDLVRAALRQEHITVHNSIYPEADTGFTIALTDDNAERTFISVAGAESRRTEIIDLTVHPGDTVIISGYSLLTPRWAAETAVDSPCAQCDFIEWITTAADSGATIVFDPGPLLTEIPQSHLFMALEAANIISVNLEEAHKLLHLHADKLEIMGKQVGATAGSEFKTKTSAHETKIRQTAQADPTELCARLAATTQTTTIVRAGKDGAYYAEYEHGKAIKAARIPGYAVHAVDTNGAGDTHTGVLSACLTQGYALQAAIKRANAAAAIAVTKIGPATAPTRTEIDELIAQNS